MTATVQLDHHHFGVHPDDPRFDLGAARKAHADVMRRYDDPVEGDDFKAMLLFAIQNATAEQIEKYRPQIQRFLDAWGKQQSKTVGKAIIKAYVASTVEVAKDWDPRKHLRGQPGNAGQFRRMAERIVEGKYEPAAQKHGPGLAEGQSYTEQYGYEQPSYEANYQADALRRYQTLLAQSAMIGSAGPEGLGEQKVFWRISDKKGNVRTVLMPPGQLPPHKKTDTFVGMRGAGVSPEPEGLSDRLMMQGRTFNLLQALGAPPSRAAQFADVPGAAHAFARDWESYENENYGNDVGSGFGNIKAGAMALGSIASGSPKAQAALAVGKVVGVYGPEAEKYLGSHARKIAYKYRGVQRPPRDIPRRQAMNAQDYHDVLTARLARFIPPRITAELNLASGYTAPSHGYILNKEGNVVAEAHGYADDHYLPFKLSGLTKLRNGSYIRTRSAGGPTTEDIYTAAITGARSFTVESRSGVYEVAFDPEFIHQKRFGDIALGMSRRYGKILDAVASGRVRAYGQVSEADYEQMVVAAKQALVAKEPANAKNPNLDAMAEEVADKMKADQEAPEGRMLHLDGEGYDYALQSLASMYPFFIHYQDREHPREHMAPTGLPPTGWTPPGARNDPFIDVDSQDSVIRQIGNVKESDTGYVKPRHIKSFDALVGYFDTSIRGAVNPHGAAKIGHTAETSRKHGGIEAKDVATGKIRGDLAFYQNWRHNPYRGKPEGAKKPTGETPRSARAATTTEHGARVTGGGRKDYSGMDAHGRELHKAVVRIYTKHRDNDDLGALNGTMFRHWAKNPDDFARAYDADPAGLQAKIESQLHRSNITDVKIAAYADAHEDTQATQYHLNARADELRVRVHAAAATPIRNELQKAAAKLYADDPVKYQNANPEGSWDFYHAINPASNDTVIDAAFPAGTPDGKAKRVAARKLMEDEKELYGVEEQLGKDDHWHPENWKNYPGMVEPAGEAEAAQAAAGTATREEGERNTRESLIENFQSVLSGLMDKHRADEPSDIDERTLWARQGKALNEAFDAWDEASQGDSPGENNLGKAMAATKALIEHDDERDKAGRPVLVNHPVEISDENGNRQAKTIRSLFKRAKEHIDEYVEKSAPRYGISKRADGQYRLRRVA